MSVHAVEKILYEICNSGERAEQYRSEPKALLARYPLKEIEAEMVAKLDVLALSDYGVNPMLIMTTWNTVVGPNHIGTYLGKLNEPRAKPANGGSNG